MAAEPSIFRHVADWLESYSGAATWIFLIAIGRYAFVIHQRIGMLEQKVGVLEEKVEQNKVEREKEFVGVHEVLSEIRQNLKENSEKLVYIRSVQVGVATKVDLLMSALGVAAIESKIPHDLKMHDPPC